MSDLIEKRKAIDVVESFDIFDGHADKQELIYRIKQLPPAQPEPQWIPVSERSPKKYGWYLCTCKDGRVTRLYWYPDKKRWIDNVRQSMFSMYYIIGKATSTHITEDQENVDWTNNVIAWMPLPEPYRAERISNDKDR